MKIRQCFDMGANGEQNRVGDWGTPPHPIGNRPVGALPRYCGRLSEQLILETHYPCTADD